NNPRVDFSGTYHLFKNLDNIPDGSSHFSVSYVDGNNNPRVDFSGTYHLFKNLDNIGDGSTYARFPLQNFDNMSNRRISTVAGAISPLGSIVTGGVQIAFSYTSTTDSITISWTLPGTTSTNPVVLRMDGTQTSIPYGSVTISGLASSTSFIAAPYVDEANETIAFVTGETGATGSPAILYPGTTMPVVVGWQQSLQGNLPLGTFQASTTSSGSGGGNGSTGCCLRGDQLIECMFNGSLYLLPARELTKEHRLFSIPGCIRIVALRTESWAEWYHVRLSNGKTLVVAGDHRFVDPCGEQVHAKDLRLQQVLQAADGYVEVVQLELDRSQNHKVSIEVEEPHVYYVDGILAHNKALC
ncbi:MAG: Hint domain-containing protein, partial [Steroidobacteraceae bacterium]